eukprot:1155839-Pelagomonas_calceolata.AAC.15
MVDHEDMGLCIRMWHCSSTAWQGHAPCGVHGVLAGGWGIIHVLRHFLLFHAWQGHAPCGVPGVLGGSWRIIHVLRHFLLFHAWQGHAPCGVHGVLAGGWCIKNI